MFFYISILYEKSQLDYYTFTIHYSQLQLILIVTDIIQSLLLLFTVGILTIWQLYLLAFNMTSIEYEEYYDVKKNLHNNFIFPYELGIVNNIKTLFGTNVLLWIFPIHPTGEGVEFVTINALDWPPIEYKKAYKYNNFTDSEDDEEIQVKNNDYEEMFTPGSLLYNLHNKKNKLVRKGSEGYLVREYTTQEREEMVTSIVNSMDDNQSQNIN